MPYAIIRTGGKQYRVEPGKTYRIPSLPGDPGASVTFSDILLGNDGTKTHVGVPALTGASVAAEIVKHGRGEKIVVCDVPLLFEKKMADEFNRIVLVDAPRPLRLERLTHERSLDETEALDMIAAQMPAELKRARADFVIDNTGTMTDLEAKVAHVWTELEREADTLASTVTI